jgi:methyltransferase (TIGR00027 family)
MTAWWTAAARAIETRRDDRLFDDPWAAVLAGPRRIEEYDAAVDGGSVHDLHAVITRYFDEFLLDATASRGLRQVVLVAAGLDARAFRLPWPADVRIVELDQMHVITYKNTILSMSGATPLSLRQAVGVDLAGAWTDHLIAAGFRPDEPSVWLIEESLYFFHERAAHALLHTIEKLAAADSRIGFNIVNREMLTNAQTRHWTARMASAGAAWLYTVDDPERLLADLGWSAAVVEPGVGAADFGRHPYPVRPRSESGTARCFLATATKSAR